MRLQVYLVLVKFFTLLLLGSGNVSGAEDFKALDHMEERVKSWISNYDNVTKKRIRLFIPTEIINMVCPEKLKLSKIKKNLNTVKITCAKLQWSTEIRYSVTKERKEYIGYIFQKDIPSGHKIKESDIEMSVFGYSAASFEQIPTKILGKFTSKEVKKGDRIRKNALVEPAKVILIEKYLPKATIIEPMHVTETEIARNQTNSQNELLLAEVIGSKTERNLNAGTILSQNDILFPYNAIVTKEKILRNTEMKIRKTCQEERGDND